RLTAWAASLRDQEGSDLYLVADAAPSIRVQGALRPLADEPLGGEEIEQSVLPLLPPHAVVQYRTSGAADASFRLEDLGRFRVNLHRERGRPAASIRALPLHPPQLGELGLPTAVEALAGLPHGLVLVGGPTGSGKTTTVAALV